jgi:peptidoglycan/LPS O-acetylase OafA/YrhL
MERVKPSTHRDDVDGLRAVAVLPVILFHAGVTTFVGGFVGVDIFFVISGYVIALSLNKDFEAGRFSILRFYERRARRILPALMVVLAATFLVSLFVAPPVFFGPFAQSLIYAGTFVPNLFFWNNTGYFAHTTFHPLLHTWSLGVEEQYYIVAPLLLFLVFQLSGRRWTAWLVPLLLASFALSVYSTTTYAMANFFSLPTRAWELLLGALLALAPPPQLSSGPARQALAVLGLALIAAPVLFYTQSTPFPGLAAAPPCIGAAILIYLGVSPKPPAIIRFLSWRPIVIIGLISFSLYLVHWPLLVIARFMLMRTPTPVETAWILAATFACAGALYVLVEQPLRHAPAPRSIGFGLALVAIAGSIFAGLIGPRVNLRMHRRIDAYPGAIQTNWAPTTATWRSPDCLVNLDGDNPNYLGWQAENCARTDGAGGNILLWGDSYAAHYAAGLEHESARLQGRVLQYTGMGCPPVLSFYRYDRPHCIKFNQHALEIIDRNHIQRVVLAAAWFSYERHGVEQIGSTLAALHQRGVETILIGQSPAFFMDPALMALMRNQPSPAGAVEHPVPEVDEVNAMLSAQAREAGALFIDPTARLCTQGLCPYLLDGVNLYIDGGHYTREGSVYAVRAYFPYLQGVSNAAHIPPGQK